MNKDLLSNLVSMTLAKTNAVMYGAKEILILMGKPFGIFKPSSTSKIAVRGDGRHPSGIIIYNN